MTLATTSNSAPVSQANARPAGIARDAAGPPTVAEERELFAVMRNAPDEASRIAARNVIVERFLPAAKYVLGGAGERRTRQLAGFEFADLLGEATVELIDAVERYEDRGHRFLSYLRPRIEGRLSHLCRDDVSRYRKSYSEPFEHWLDEPASVTAFEQHEREQRRSHLVEQLRIILRHNKAKLTTRQRRLIRARFYGRRPARQVAASFGVTVETMHKWCTAIYAKLRACLEWLAFGNPVRRSVIAERLAELRRRRGQGGNHRRSAFGQWLMSLARRRGIHSMCALADRVGIARRNMSKLLQRTTPSKKPQTRQALCRVLGIDIDTLLNWRTAGGTHA